MLWARHTAATLVAVSFENTLRSLELDSRRSGLVFVAGGVALFVVWMLLAFTIELPLTVASVDGRVVAAAQPIELKSVSPEPIAEVTVQLGQRVAEGASLIRFDATQFEFDLSSTKERVQKLTDELASLRREIAASEALAVSEGEEFDHAMDRLRARVGETRAVIEHDEKAEQIYAALRSQRRIDELKYSEAKSKLAQDRKSLEAESAELLEKESAKRLAFNQRGVERAQLQGKEAQLAGDIAELQPKIRQLERRVAELSVRAPFAGQIGAMANLTVGQIVDRGTWLMTLVPDRGFEFEANFAAADAAGRVQPQQPVRIEFFALPWTQYGLLDGRVKRVGSEERDGRVRVDIELEPRGPLYESISHGLKGRATVLVEETTLARKLVNLLGAARSR
jgi:hemolysin D